MIQNQLDSIIHTLKDLGRRRAIVLHGAHGMDEATLSGNNLIYELDENGNVNHYTLNAQDLGFSYAPDSELKGGSPEENRRITLDILNGKTDHQKEMLSSLMQQLHFMSLKKYIAFKLEYQ